MIKRTIKSTSSVTQVPIIISCQLLNILQFLSVSCLRFPKNPTPYIFGCLYSLQGQVLGQYLQSQVLGQYPFLQRRVKFLLLSTGVGIRSILTPVENSKGSLFRSNYTFSYTIITNYVINTHPFGDAANPQSIVTSRLDRWHQFAQ